MRKITKDRPETVFSVKTRVSDMAIGMTTQVGKGTATVNGEDLDLDISVAMPGHIVIQVMPKKKKETDRSFWRSYSFSMQALAEAAAEEWKKNPPTPEERESAL